LTSAICLRLNADGWSDWYDGMNDRHLAAMPRPYEIHSKSVRQGNATATPLLTLRVGLFLPS
jgi:hypothetical protein